MKETNSYIFFYKNYLSNFHKCHITDPRTGLSVRTSEQLFMWYKADFFGDLESRTKLSNYDLMPKAAKDIGRLVKGYDEKVWDTVRFGFMTYVNYLKYSQNKDIQSKLLSTYPKILAEASPIDNIWGIGLDESEDDWILTDQRNWTGQNLLGKALMKVREIIMKQ